MFLGRSQRHRSDSLREPLGVLQGALLGIVGLILAFGLALAVGRYGARRGAVVEEANAIGTTYLRAQTLAEPVRTGSLERLVRYTDTSIRLSHSVPGTPAARQAVADGQQLLVTFDLDRPTRGLIRIPSTALTNLRASMVLPPAATGPARP